MDVIKLPKSDYESNNALMVDHHTKFVEVVKPILNQSAEGIIVGFSGGMGDNFHQTCDGLNRSCHQLQLQFVPVNPHDIVI